MIAACCLSTLHRGIVKKARIVKEYISEATSIMPTDTGKLIPICCSSELSTKVGPLLFLLVSPMPDQSGKSVKEFWNALYNWPEGHGEHNQYWEPFFVVIQDLDQVYDQSTSKLDGRRKFSSPFIDKSFEQIAKLLRSSRLDTGSDINYVHFVILDKEGIEGRWAYLCCGEDAEEKNDSIKVDFVKGDWSIVDETMLSRCVGKPSMDELQESAKKEKDGVCRI